MKVFDKKDLQNLYKPEVDSSGEDNGQITIIGGSELFHGAPILSLKVASRIVDMVFFASPEPSIGRVAEKFKSELMSFIWIPWEDVKHYVEKSDAILIGPGFMRFNGENVPYHIRHNNCDETCRQTREITKKLLTEFSNKKWVIDAGSLQTMDKEWIPKGAILTPNRKEFELLFGGELNRKVKNTEALKISENAEELTSNLTYLASKYDCTIVLKGPETIVASPNDLVVVKGGNPGLTKGGTGDVLAGLAVSLYAKNDALLAASSASYIVKAAADELFKEVGITYNSDDLADKIPEVFSKLI